MVGTAGDDVLRGTDGVDVMVGRSGDDTIRGLGGADVICGGAGDDVLFGGGGGDVMLGGMDVTTSAAVPAPTSFAAGAATIGSTAEWAMT
jgi:Ca2+-binding RTX toxin-like protein